MKIIVVSDTHNSTNLMEKEILPRHEGEAQVVLHLGDFADDLIELKEQFPSYEMAWVGGAYELDKQRETILEFLGKKILITHGHMLGVKEGLNRIVNHAASQNVDACFFGHTHQATMFKIDNILFMNPGNLVEHSMGNKNSYGLVTITDDGEISGEVVYL